MNENENAPAVSPVPPTAWSPENLEMARLFHDVYEEEAQNNEWESQTPVGWDDLPPANKRTMLATVARVRSRIAKTVYSELIEQINELESSAPPVAPSEPSIYSHDENALPDNELPGMWEHADYEGGRLTAEELRELHDSGRIPERRLLSPAPSVGELEAVNEQLERECRDWINLYEGALKDAGDALAALTSARETFLSIALTPSKSSCPEAHAMAQAADDAANALRAFPTVRASVGELEWETRKDRRTIARIKSGPWSVVDYPSGGCWLRFCGASVKFCESESAAKSLANSLQRILSGAAE